MRPDIEKYGAISKEQEKELEHRNFPRILSRRSYLKVLSLGMMALVGTAASQSIFERFIKDSEKFKQIDQAEIFENISKRIRNVFNRE